MLSKVAKLATRLFVFTFIYEKRVFLKFLQVFDKIVRIRNQNNGTGPGEANLYTVISSIPYCLGAWAGLPAESIWSPAVLTVIIIR
jgi:hypothetical protein